MNRSNTRRSRIAERRRKTRRFFIVFIAVLFVCMAIQITLIARLTGQNKQIRAVEREAQRLGAEADNLNLALNQLGNLDRVSAQAERIGMKLPGEGQIRVVNLPEAVENTSAQSAGNTSAEESRE